MNGHTVIKCDSKSIIDAIKVKIKDRKLSIADVATKAGLSYNTTKNILDNPGSGVWTNVSSLLIAFDVKMYFAFN